MLGLALDPTEFERIFRLKGPILVSFSGGRTSALMLWCVIVAHGGVLPSDVVVVFANTGKEREETLWFVYQIGLRWGVTIHWVEYRPKPEWLAVVDYHTASRNGEPLMMKFAVDGRLPTAIERICTGETKRRTIRRFALRRLGWKQFVTLVGLRADEGARVLSQVNANRRAQSKKVSPLAWAGIRKPDVLRFWLGANDHPKRLRAPLPQGFDLGLEDHEGNCDRCFLKGFAKNVRLEREQPGGADWWIAAEDRFDARFERKWSYRDVKVAAAKAGPLPVDDTPNDDAECGDACYLSASPAERAAEQRFFDRAMAAGELAYPGLAA